MLDYQQIKELTVKYQTVEENVVREYFQSLFLSWFYSQAGSGDFLFKGGTALRLVFDSPRFSEDLDFSGVKNGRNYENILLEVLEKIEKMRIEYQLVESKETSGGWLAILKIKLYGRVFQIKNEISFRKKKLEKEDKLISRQLVPAFRIVLLKTDLLIKEKVQAALSRQKARDFFDLYFILRTRQLRNSLSLGKKKRKRLIRIIKKLDKGKVERSLKNLLPQSYHQIIKNLPKRLEKELHI